MKQDNRHAVTGAFGYSGKYMAERLIGALVGVAVWVQVSAGGQSAAWGPHAVGWREVTVERRGPSTFQAVACYPAAGTGHAMPLSQAEAPYPGVTFGHGFLSPPVLYTVSMAHLASHGYVVIAPRSGLELAPDWFAYADDFRFCLDYLEIQNEFTDSFLYRAIDTGAFGMTGHSMGGGSSILAAAADPRVRAVVPLAPARFGPPSGEAIAALNVPVCILAAGDDAITPMPVHTWPLFLGAGPPSLMAVIRGASHCQFSDLPVPDPFCDEARIDRARQHEITREFVVGFLDLYLKGKGDAWDRIWGPSALFDPDVQVWARPGVTLRPRWQVRYAPPGRPVTFEVSVLNRGAAPDRYRLSAWGDAQHLALEPGTTAMVAPGEATQVRVTIAIRPGATGPAFAVLNTRSDHDGATGTYAILLLL